MTLFRTIFLGAAMLLAPMAQAGDRSSVLRTLENTPELSTLVTALEAAGLLETIADQTPVTIFAPSNAAFEALPAGTLEVLLLPENAEQLENILLYHVDDRRLTTWHMLDAPTYYRPLLDDTKMCITKGPAITIDDGSGDVANITTQDIRGPNGVVHIIDKVLLPGTLPDCS